MQLNLQMSDRFDPKSIEQNFYNKWEQSNCFKPSFNNQTPNFCIALPPPNVTGTLHMGHAFQQTLMDILIRFNRMKGANTLWQGGTDHAGIATQMVVERNLLKEGKSKHDFDREEFIKQIWKWKEFSGDAINQQMRRLGVSMDWSRSCFTMDENFAKAVKEVFIQLFEAGLIYRGKRLVNWDVKLKTAVSDLEVENKDENGFMYHLRYPFVDESGFMYIATTRPETILADSCLAVHPDDERYKNVIGKKVRVPLTDRIIEVIADTYPDPEFGTGCVKITPAHDFNDYEVGKRHNLEMLNIMNLDGTLNENVPEKYQGLERFEAREKIIADLKSEGFLEKIEPHQLKRPYGDRSGVVIEPLLTDQWYVKIEPLAKPAIEAVKDKRIEFIPKQYENLYFSWMNNIQDWCISRQLWWGHRIPAWYDVNGNVYVGRDEAQVRAKYNLGDIKLTQDEDVLDTWFSSALWTFGTLGWSGDRAKDLANEMLKQFHPTSVLVTGFDIIFFWVARMIMFTMHFMKDAEGNSQIPFKKVYITGLIRDEEGQKMSKSKGNVIDPLDMIDGISLDDLIAKRTSNLMQPKQAEKIAKATKKAFPEGINAYGTDALRFTLTALASNGRDINWDMKRLEGYRNFCNKIWNASRFVFMQLEQNEIDLEGEKEFSTVDLWIESKFNQAVLDFHKAIEQYRFDMLANVIYEFTWHTFCDWYLEFSKPIFAKGNKAQKNGTGFTILSILEKLLRLMHPIMPFISEEIWQKIKDLLGIKGETIMLSQFPEFEQNLNHNKAVEQIEFLQKAIVAIRNVRAEANIAPKVKIDCRFYNLQANQKQAIFDNLQLISTMVKIDKLEVIEKVAEDFCARAFVEGAEIFIPMAGHIDVNAEISRLNKQLDELKRYIQNIENKLANENFVSKAPKNVVDAQKEQLTKLLDNKEKLELQISGLQNI